MYGDSRNIRYILGLFAVIALLFFAIFLIVRGSGSSEPKVSETKRTLTSYASDNSIVVSQTVIGPITAAEDHYQSVISVSQTVATIELVRGYDGNVVSSRSYPMSQASFSEFLYSLDRVGFTSGNTAEELKNDEGFCPTGQRYVYQIMDGTSSIQRFWTTSCGGTRTYRGNLNLTTSLFKAQIPDYSTIINNPENSSNLSL